MNLKRLLFRTEKTVRSIRLRRAQKKKYGPIVKGMPPLTADQRRQALAFWKPYGVKPDIIYPTFYTDSTGVFDARYMPHDIFYTHIDPYFNNVSAAKYFDNKTLYNRLFPGIPQAENIVYRRAGFFFDGATDRIISEKEAVALVRTEGRAVLKYATESLGGKGVQFYEAADAAFSLEDYFARTKRDFVAQRVLSQHPDLNAINASSVNSLRIVSLLCLDEVMILACTLRMGIDGARVDNASSGGVFCGVNEDGTLKAEAFNGKGERIRTHPTSGIVFEGYQIPAFELARSLVKNAHRYVPEFRLVSWDICITEPGQPVLIEANLCQGGLRVPQFCNGPLFGDDTESILSEVFHKY